MRKNIDNKKHFTRIFATILITSTLLTNFTYLTTSEITDGIDQNQRDSLYKYHTSYSQLVQDMQNLNSQHPDIFELTTAQDEYGLDDIIDGSNTYKTWIIRITNEKTGFNKPEVLFIGCHHGDEGISLEAAYYYAEWLAENYETDPYIKYLVDHREIYIMPLLNPYGWVHNTRYDEHGLDMNRDYPFDETTGGGYPFGTIGARAVHELTKEHLFINTASWHSGTEMIAYAWGCYAHTDNTECPDDKAFYYEGKYMSDYGGPYSGYYQYGRANDILYPCYGAYEDYAYAMSWDTENSNPSWPTNGCRSLTHCIEISNIKEPPESTLGGRADIYTPGGDEDGYIPKNIRMALLLTDTAQPYINITSQLPQIAATGQHVNISWRVMGAFSTDETNIQYSTNPNPIQNPQWSTPTQSGGTGWQNVTYTQQISMPTTPGVYYFTIRAKVDHNTLQQNNPDPNSPPKSLWVNMRTNDTWQITNHGNTLQGQTNWYSEIFKIPVGEDTTPPETTLEIEGIKGGDNWYTGTPKVELKSTDDLSGVNYTMYRLNEEEWQLYTGPLPTKEGINTVEFYSADYAGNQEETKTGRFKYDKTPPETTCNITGETGEINSWYNTNITITLQAADNTSGLKETLYRLNNETWHTYTQPLNIEKTGRYALEFYATDIAGNEEKHQMKNFSIDKNKPFLKLLKPLGGETLTGNVSIEWLSDDDLSPTLVSLYFTVNNKEKMFPIATNITDQGSYIWDTTKTFDGSYTLQITIKDYAGNQITNKTGKFNIENGIPPPEIALKFIHPQPGEIVLFNNRFLSTPGNKVIAIGDLNISVDAQINSEMIQIQIVNFYLDNQLVKTDKNPPYSWTWNTLSFSKHVVQAEALDDLDNKKTITITVLKIL